MMDIIGFAMKATPWAYFLSHCTSSQNIITCPRKGDSGCKPELPGIRKATASCVKLTMT